MLFLLKMLCCAMVRWWRRLAGEALISSEQQQWEFTKAGRFETFSKHAASQKLGRREAPSSPEALQGHVFFVLSVTQLESGG